MINLKEENIKPFLRWAGGKSWLIKHLSQVLPKDGFNNYHEPFLGGGSVFLSLLPQKKSFLSDLNSDLINTYKILRDRPDDVIKILSQYQNTKEFYYRIREAETIDLVEKAAKFIYLNQTSFNGIYRVNLNGVYNVPYGYRTKDFLDSNNLKKVSSKLQKSHIFSADFEEIKSNIKKGDLIYLDPPYTVSHNNNGFIKYNQKIFSLEDQFRLSNLIDFIRKKNAYYILSNAAHHKIIEIFDKNDKMITFDRASLIGGLNAKRGKVEEFIFTNTF